LPAPLKLLTFSESDSLKFIETAPFDKLIPKVSEVVFHGGIGIIAECLRAGVPFSGCPVIYPMGEQYFWVGVPMNLVVLHYQYL